MPDRLSVSPPVSSADAAQDSPSDMWESVIPAIPMWD